MPCGIASHSVGAFAPTHKDGGGCPALRPKHGFAKRCETTHLGFVAQRIEHAFPTRGDKGSSPFKPCYLQRPFGVALWGCFTRCIHTVYACMAELVESSRLIICLLLGDIAGSSPATCKNRHITSQGKDSRWGPSMTHHYAYYIVYHYSSKVAELEVYKV